MLIYFGYTLYQGEAVRGEFTEKDLVPASFDPGNGFYIFLALPEPAGVDIFMQKHIDKYREIFDPNFSLEAGSDDRRVFPPRTWNQNNKASYAKILKIIEREHFFGGLYSFEKNKILSLKKELSFLLERYQRLINSEKFEDFTEPGFDFLSFPYEPFVSGSGLFLAVNVLEAIDGKWETAVGNILKQIAFLKKFLKTGRYSHYFISRYILTTVLLDLGRIIDLESCPPAVFFQIVEKMTPLSNQAFLSKNALISFYLYIANYLDNQPFWKFCIQGNRTKQYFLDSYKAQIKLEEEVPFQRKTSRGEIFKKSNAQRKKILFSGVGNLIADYHIASFPTPGFQSTYRTRALYHLVRISAELRLTYDPQKTVEENLVGLDSYKRIDPFSGRRYNYSRERKVLYSFGRNLEDNGGVVSFNTNHPSDIAVPCTLHTSQ
jgi:hypothetical protein